MKTTITSILLLTAAAAFGGTPRLNHIMPAACQRGGEVEITLRGSNITDAREILWSEPGLTVSDIKVEGNAVKAKVKAAPDARIGEYNARLITKGGISDVRLFYVTPFPVVAEQAEDKKDRKKPQAVSLGSTISGTTPEDDEDRYEIDAKKGQRISVESLGNRVNAQSQYDPMIAVLKTDGTQIAEADDQPFGRQDPVLSFIAPEDGKYLVTVRDSTNAGPGQSSYLMSIGTFPRPVAVYPAGGPAGEEVKFTFIGDATGPIQRTIKLPDAPNAQYPLLIEDGQMAPLPVLVRVSPMPNVLEAEPNDKPTEATAVTTEIPFAANGIIEKPSDTDYFKFTAKKGTNYDINVYARRLRSGLDSVIDIFNANGNRIGGNDDSGSTDSYVRWAAPADGTFMVAVRDQLNRGNPAFTYRIEITNVAPQVLTYLPAVTINQDQDRRMVPVAKGNRFGALVRFKRVDVGGDMNITAVDLPEGVTVTGGFAEKGVDTIPMVFEAKADAPDRAKAFTLAAKFVEAEKANVPSAVEHKVDIGEYGNQRPFFGVVENTLPIAVIDEVPATIELHQPKVPLLQSGSMALKVKLQRKGDFKGPVTMSLLYSPPGIGTPGTVPIKEGESEGVLTISANSNAPAGKWKTCIVATVDSGKGPVYISTALIDLEVQTAPVGGSLTRTFIDQGDTGSMTLKLDQKTPFEGKAKIVLVSLPNGVTCEEQFITKDDKEVKFKLKAEPNAQVGQHKQVIAQFTLEKNGEPMQSSIASGGVLRVDKASVAAATAAK